MLSKSQQHCLLLDRPRSIARAALFLDRDGVLIEEKNYLCDPTQVQLLPGALPLLKKTFEYGWPVILITNQSGIARGYFDWDAYERVTNRLIELLGPTAPLAAIYANGHGPDAPTSSWRKPSPAMLQTAAADLRLDLGRSLLIGDRLSDLLAGAHAGLAWLGHVSTGHGERERPDVEHWIATMKTPIEQNPTYNVVLLETLLDFPYDLLRKGT